LILEQIFSKFKVQNTQESHCNETAAKVEMFTCRHIDNSCGLPHRVILTFDGLASFFQSSLQLLHWQKI